RLDVLQRIPAALKFVSAEPLLERIDFSPHLSKGFLDWIITGCERAGKAQRLVMDLSWVREIDAQCRAFQVSHFFKQAYDTVDGREVGVPNESPMLDGQVVQELPKRRVSLPLVQPARKNSDSDLNTDAIRKGDSLN